MCVSEVQAKTRTLFFFYFLTGVNQEQIKAETIGEEFSGDLVINIGALEIQPFIFELMSWSHER